MFSFDERTIKHVVFYKVSSLRNLEERCSLDRGREEGGIKPKVRKNKDKDISKDTRRREISRMAWPPF